MLNEWLGFLFILNFTFPIITNQVPPFATFYTCSHAFHDPFFGYVVKERFDPFTKKPEINHNTLLPGKT
tara:strand:- start:242 stop:448 length:207 start_codon:yes stop_codon:yes gene_type:complete